MHDPLHVVLSLRRPTLRPSPKTDRGRVAMLSQKQRRTLLLFSSAKPARSTTVDAFLTHKEGHHA